MAVTNPFDSVVNQTLENRFRGAMIDLGNDILSAVEDNYGPGLSVTSHTLTATAATATLTIPGLRAHHLLFPQVSTATATCYQGLIISLKYASADTATLTFSGSIDQSAAVVKVLRVDPTAMPYGAVCGRTAAGGAADDTTLTCIVPGLQADHIVLGAIEVVGVVVNASLIQDMQYTSAGLATFNFDSDDLENMVGIVAGFRNYGSKIVAATYAPAAGAVESIVIPVPGCTTSHTAFLSIAADATDDDYIAQVKSVVAGTDVVTVTTASHDPDGATLHVVCVK